MRGLKRSAVQLNLISSSEGPCDADLSIRWVQMKNSFSLSSFQYNRRQLYALFIYVGTQEINAYGVNADQSSKVHDRHSFVIINIVVHKLMSGASRFQSIQPLFVFTCIVSQHIRSRSNHP